MLKHGGDRSRPGLHTEAEDRQGKSAEARDKHVERSAPVERPPLALESKDNIERGDRLALCVLSVGDRVADHALKEGLEHTTGLFVDQARDTLDTTT